MRRSGGIAIVVFAGCGRIGFAPGDAGDPPVQVAHWDELGGSATGGGISMLPPGLSIGGPRLALTSDERPVVSWSDAASGNTEVYLAAWTGAVWGELGGSRTGGGISNDPESSYIGGLAIDTDDRICQAWVPDELNLLRMRCWDGATWIGLGGSELQIPTPGNPWWPSVAFVEGQPTVAWEDYGGGEGGVYARRFDGATWLALGPASLPGIAGPGQNVSLDSTSTTEIWLAWSNGTAGDVYASRWSGAGWTAIGPTGVSATEVASKFPDLVIGDRPYVAWVEGEPATSAIHVRGWDGGTWAELGGSATGAGVSLGQVPAMHVVLAATPDGRPVVAYTAADDVHVRAWDGTAWVAVGGQLEDGVSRSGRAGWPELRIAPSGTMFLSWIERQPDGQQVYLRVLAAPSD